LVACNACWRGRPDVKRPHEQGPVGMRELAYAPQLGPTDAAEACAPAHVRAGYKGLLVTRVTVCCTLFSIHRAALALVLMPSVAPSHATSPCCTLPPRCDLPSPFPLPLTVGYNSSAALPSPAFSPSSLGLAVWVLLSGC
jgi:hypothetical protein